MSDGPRLQRAHNCSGCGRLFRGCGFKVTDPYGDSKGKRYLCSIPCLRSWAAKLAALGGFI